MAGVGNLHFWRTVEIGLRLALQSRHSGPAGPLGSLTPVIRPHSVLGYLLLSCLIPVFASAARAQAASELPDDCMALADVRIGMIGEARTVAQGFDPEPLRVEIIGIEKGALAGSAMILARVEGPYLEKHGIVAGMSGSPVYIDGKIIGALAYGWSFSYRPIAGITPIESMLSIWDDLDETTDPAADAHAASASGASSSKRSASLSLRGWDWASQWDQYQASIFGRDNSRTPMRVLPPRPTIKDPRSYGLDIDSPITLEPMTTPLFVSNISAGSYELLENFLSSRGLHLFGAGSSAGSNLSPDVPSPEIVPGSAIGVPFMTGDVTLAGIGTVTYRRGNRLLGFGHPMFFQGAVDVPLSHAYIFGYMQSYATSFKLGEVREIFGSIRQDRQFAIGGVFGPGPERLDLRIAVGGEAASNPHTYNFSVWEDRNFTPILTALIAVGEAFRGSISAGGDLTATCHYTIDLADGTRIEKHLINSSRQSTSTPFSMALLRDLFMLTDNPYRMANVESITMEIDARPVYGFKSLIKAQPRYRSVRPGDDLLIDMIWEPYRGERHSETLRVELPDDIRPGAYVIHIADSGVAQRIDTMHKPGQFAPRDYAETIALAKRLNYPDNRLSVYLFRPELSVGLYSETFEGLPGSIGDLMEASAPSEIKSPVIGRLISKRKIDYSMPINGSSSFTIEVAHHIPE